LDHRVAAGVVGMSGPPASQPIRPGQPLHTLQDPRHGKQLGGVVEPRSRGLVGPVPGELVEDQEPAWCHQLASPLGRLLERVHVVERQREDHRLEGLAVVDGEIGQQRRDARLPGRLHRRGVDVDGRHVIAPPR
jgi:hypothetical protein